MMHVLEREQLVEASLAEVFDFFSHAHNLEALTPPWLRFHVLTPDPAAMHAGAQISYRLRARGVPLNWVSEIEQWQPPWRFVDRQLRGPYRNWHHTHEFQAHSDGTLIRDTVAYELTLGRLGELVHAAVVRRDIERIFDYRQEKVASVFSRAPSAARA